MRSAIHRKSSQRPLSHQVAARTPNVVLCRLLALAEGCTREHQPAGAPVAALAERRGLHARIRVAAAVRPARNAPRQMPALEDPGTGLDLARFDAAPLIAITAPRETGYGAETKGKVPPRCGAYSAAQRANARTVC